MYPNTRHPAVTLGPDVDLRTSPRHRPFAWPVIAALLAAYIAAEIAFNLELVHTVAQADIDRARLDRLVQFGKATGSFGLVLFVVRPFFAHLWRRVRWGLPFGFLAAWMATYGAIDSVYDRVLAQVPQSIQREAFYLTFYRDALFRGALQDGELAGPDGAADDLQRLALINIAARLTGEKAEIAAARDKYGQAKQLQQAGLLGDARLDAAMRQWRADPPQTLRDATAAILLPPMSMTLSLMAIVANVAALAALLLTVALRRRRSIRVLAPMLPAMAVFVALLAAETPPFPEGTQSRELYSRLDDRLGFWGWVWSRAINGQAIILRLTADDAPPRAG